MGVSSIPSLGKFSLFNADQVRGIEACTIFALLNCFRKLFQVIVGINSSLYYSNFTLYSTTLRASLSQCVNLSMNSIVDLSISSISASASAYYFVPKLRALDGDFTSSSQSVVNSINAAYAVMVSGAANMTSMEEELRNAVSSGQFNIYLTQNALRFGSLGFVNCTSSSVQIITTSAAPTSEPTLYLQQGPSSSFYSNSNSLLSSLPTILIVFLLSLPGLLYFIAGTIAHITRSANKAYLNPLNSFITELLELFLKSLFLAIMINKAVINYGVDTRASFYLFLTSRLWLFCLWMLFWFEFLRHRTIVGDDGIHLSQLINFDMLSSKRYVWLFSTVAIFGILDMTILRLLPWKPSEFSKYVGGYPNLFSLRCIVYGSNISLLLQCFSSLLLLVHGESVLDTVLSAILFVLSIFMMLKTLVATLFGIQRERSSKMVEVRQLDLVRMRSISSSRESLLRKLERLSQNRLSETDFVVKTENPLRYSGLFPPRQSENVVVYRESDHTIMRQSKEWRRKSEVEVKDPPVIHDIEMVKPPAAVAFPPVVEDNSSGQYLSNVPYAEKTVNIMKSLLTEKGMDNIPVYIPLDQIKAELSSLMKDVNENRPFDEKRFDYLLLCMNYNEDYIKEKEAEARQWRDKMSAFSQECLHIQRGFTPPHIFSSSVTSMVTTDGLSEVLAKRFINKKCLWLVRVPAADIDQLHEADLMGRLGIKYM